MNNFVYFFGITCLNSIYDCVKNQKMSTIFDLLSISVFECKLLRVFFEQINKTLKTNAKSEHSKITQEVLDLPDREISSNWQRLMRTILLFCNL